MPYRIVKKEIHLCMELVPEERFCRTNIQNSDMEFQEYLGILNFSTGIWKYNKSWYVSRSKVGQTRSIGYANLNLVKF